MKDGIYIGNDFTNIDSIIIKVKNERVKFVGYVNDLGFLVKPNFSSYDTSVKSLTKDFKYKLINKMDI